MLTKSVLSSSAMQHLGRARTTSLSALAIYTLSTGMMIQFTSSSSESALNGIIACQVLISLSSGIHAVSAYIGVLDGASPSTLSMRLALAYLSTMIVASISLAISGAIWTNVFPARLASNLADMGLSPEEETRIYSSLIVQLSYGPGTPIRNAIIRSYGEVFRTIMTAATALSVVSWVGAIMMRDITASERDAKERGPVSMHERESTLSPGTRSEVVKPAEK